MINARTAKHLIKAAKEVVDTGKTINPLKKTKKKKRSVILNLITDPDNFELSAKVVNGEISITIKPQKHEES